MNAPSLESRRAGGRAASRPPPGRLFCKREQAGRFTIRNAVASIRGC